MQIDIQTAPESVKAWFHQQLQQVSSDEPVVIFDSGHELAQFSRKIHQLHLSDKKENIQQSPAKLLSSGDADDGSFDDCLSKASISLKPAEFD